MWEMWAFAMTFDNRARYAVDFVRFAHKRWEVSQVTVKDQAAVAERLT